jgi:hypothetical protein
MEDPESKEGFKVTDRRRFTEEGVTRDSAETQEKPETKETPQQEPQEVRAETKGAESQPPPPMDFSMFVLSMANTALFQLGFVKDPDAGEAKKDLRGARQTIDLIALLEEKTRGNLTEQEAKIIKEALFQLRMAFVEASK